MNVTKTNFSTVVYQWLETSKGNLAPASYCKYEQLIQKHIAPALGAVECDNITAELLSSFHKSIYTKNPSESTSSLAESSVRSILMILNNSLDFAAKNQFIEKHHYVKPGIGRNHPIVHVLSLENQKKLEQFIFSEKSKYSLALLLALYTGMRIGELCGLKWGDFDFDNRSVRISRTVQRLKSHNKESIFKTELVISSPKSRNSYRQIPLPEFVMDYVLSFYMEGKENYYLISDKPDKPLDPRTLQYAYRRIMEKNGISYLNFHCLRHTFATRCITLGWDVKTLSEVLGHADIKMTMEYYFHSSFEYKREQMNKLKPLL